MIVEPIERTKDHPPLVSRAQYAREQISEPRREWHDDQGSKRRVMLMQSFRSVTFWRRARLLVGSLLVLAAISAPALAAPDRGPKVYLLRGFMNVFSLGLDELARNK